jgi:hypothetical protein
MLRLILSPCAAAQSAYSLNVSTSIVKRALSTTALSLPGSASSSSFSSSHLYLAPSPRPSPLCTSSSLSPTPGRALSVPRRWFGQKGGKKGKKGGKGAPEQEGDKVGSGGAQFNDPNAVPMGMDPLRDTRLAEYVRNDIHHDPEAVEDTRSEEQIALDDDFVAYVKSLQAQEGSYKARAYAARLYRKWEAVNFLPEHLRAEAIRPQPEETIPQTMKTLPTEFPSYGDSQARIEAAQERETIDQEVRHEALMQEEERINPQRAAKRKKQEEKMAGR